MCQCLWSYSNKGKRQMSREQKRGKWIKRMSLKEKYGCRFIFNAFILEKHSLLCYQDSYQNYMSVFFFSRNLLWWLALAAVGHISRPWTVHMECSSLVPDIHLPPRDHAQVCKPLKGEHSLACDVAIRSSSSECIMELSIILLLRCSRYELYTRNSWKMCCSP